MDGWEVFVKSYTATFAETELRTSCPQLSKRAWSCIVKFIHMFRIVHFDNCKVLSLKYAILIYIYTFFNILYCDTNSKITKFSYRTFLIFIARYINR